MILGVVAGLLTLAGEAAQAQERAQWTYRADMPTARAEVAAAVLGGRLYVAGGTDQRGRVLDIVERYDPQANRWDQAVPPLRTARYRAAAAVLDGRLYVIGGRDDEGEVLDDVEVYDPDRNEWREVESLDEGREGLAVVVLEGRIYAAGGSDEDGEILRTVEVYDPARDEWSEDPTWRLDFPRASFAAAAVNNVAFSFGGFSPVPLRFVQRFEPGRRPVTVTPPGLMRERGGLAAVALRDSIYLIGGRGPEPQGRERVLDEVTVYVPSRDRWFRAPSLNTARESFAAGAVTGRVYVVGGRDAFGDVLASMEEFNPYPDAGTGAEVPAAAGTFRLEPGHPNPFADATLIAFEVTGDAAGTVVLDVFDLAGRRVATLVDAVLPPGRHTVRWDGTSGDGRPLPGGTYVLRLRQGTQQATKTIARIRTR